MRPISNFMEMKCGLSSRCPYLGADGWVTLSGNYFEFLRFTQHVIVSRSRGSGTKSPYTWERGLSHLFNAVLSCRIWQRLLVNEGLGNYARACWRL